MTTTASKFVIESIPESVIDLVSGAMGQPPGGFPKQVQQRILGNRKPFTDRPGATLPPADFEKARKRLQALNVRKPTDRDVVSYLLYPKVYEEFVAHQQKFDVTSTLPTPIFFYGMEPGEEFSVEIEAGKTLFIKFLTTGSAHPDGTRTVFFELNGQPRDVTVTDHSMEATVKKNIKADPTNPTHIAASMPGMVVQAAVNIGDTVTRGQKLLAVEAMKMQTTINADRDGKIAQLLVKASSQVETGDLLLTIVR